MDDGSPVPPTGVAETFAGRLDVRVLRQERQGPGAARNAGAAIARGRYLAFTDDDCVPEPGWLDALVDALQRDEGLLVGGFVDNGIEGNPYADATDRIGRYVYDYYLTPAANEAFFTTNNIALSTALFRATGGFTTAIPSATAEDKEFCDRWREAGRQLRHVPGAVVHHSPAATLRSFLRQHYNYGRGIFAFRLLRQQRTGGPLLPEPLRFYAGLVTSPLRRRTRVGTLTSASLIVLAQLATAAGALHQAIRWPADRGRLRAERGGVHAAPRPSAEGHGERGSRT